MIKRIFCSAVIAAAFLLLCVTKVAGDENAERLKESNRFFSRGIGFADAADLAVAASADLRFEQKGLLLLEKARLLGLRNYFPRISLSVQENDRLLEIGADSFMKNYSVNMDQLLWDGGKMLMARRLERLELNLANARLDRMTDDIAESAILAYHNVLRMRTIISIKKAALIFLSEQIEIIEKEVELGLALSVDHAEAELALAGSRIEIIILESELLEFERQFAELLGLERLPVLLEKIDVNRIVVLPSVRTAVSLAEEKNPELVEAEFSIVKRQAELKIASRSWIPAFRVTGSFGLTGNEYPLNRYTWSVGLNIDFSNPWLQNTFSFQKGMESPRDKTAVLQNSFSPLPNPAASIGKRQAEFALNLEREKYAIALERTGRVVERAVENCRLADSRRKLASEAANIAFRRYGLEELRLGLGQITRLDLMKSRIECTEKEIGVVEAALNLMQAERELERLLDLRPGELAAYAHFGLSQMNFLSGE